MRRTVVAILLTVACTTSAKAQFSAIDSLKEVLAIYIYPDTVRINALTTLAQLSWGSNPQDTRQSAEEALVLAKKINYSKGIADAYREISRYYWSQTDYHKAIDYALIAVEQYRSLHRPEGVSWCLGTIGICYAQANNYDRSIHYQQQALELNTQIRNKQGIARNLNNLGYVSELQKNFTQALSYYQRALVMRKEIGVEADVVMPLSNVGSAHLALGDHILAREFFEQALNLAIKTNNRNLEALLQQNLGEVEYKAKHYDEARPYLQKALDIAAAIGDKKRKEGCYEILRDIEKSVRNFEAAFHYQLLLQNLRDTLYSQQRAMQIAELEQRLEKQRREQAVLMLERDQRMQKVWNNVVVTCFFTFVAGAMTFYRRQRSRQRKNLTALHSEIDNLRERHKKLTEQLITQEDTHNESQDQRLVQNAIQIVYNHLGDSQFGVEKLADMMGMSRANLHRKLKNATGFPPGDLIRQVRLKRAAHLLKQQADSVTQVGFTVGFEDQSYFSKCFKKQFGMSPSEFSRSIVPVSSNVETNLPAFDT